MIYSIHTLNEMTQTDAKLYVTIEEFKAWLMSKNGY